MEKFQNTKIEKNFINLIEKSSVDHMSSEALIYFEKRSALFVVPEQYRPNNFEEYYIIHHQNGDVTYIAEQIKNGEDISYFYETRNGEKIGHGEVRLILKPKEGQFDKPYIGFTKTDERYIKQGLGKRRLFEMTEYVRLKYSESLYSDSTILKDAESIWQKLVNEGIAKKEEYGLKYRYRLIV